MKKKIYIRLVEITVFAIMISAISMTWVQYNVLQARVQNDLAINAHLLKETGYFDIANTTSKAIDLDSQEIQLRITWINQQGNVIYDNDADTSLLENHKDRPEIKSAFESGEGQIIRRSNTLNKNTFYYALLLDNGTVLRVSIEAESILSVFVSSCGIVCLIVLFVLVICLILSKMMTNQLVKPIEVLANNIEKEDVDVPYKELEPFVDVIQKQHKDILESAKVRQDFTASVSHELKTPLTSIIGYTELLQSKVPSQQQQEHFLEEIKKSSNRLLALINDIIRLSELDHTDSQPAFSYFDLYELAKETVEELKMNAVQKEIDLKITGESCPFFGNKEMMKELVENLVQNSIRYNNPNGYACVEVWKQGNGKIIVKDNGIGIPQKDQKHVFERFYRVDKSRSKATGGTGLGLAIVKHIAEIHEGKISLQSENEKGTIITIQF